MNYILQLNGFFQRVAADDRLNPTHVSLYMAIFQYWNAGHFHNPVSISRQELMRISKICAKATYHKCIKDLNSFGYIQYMPSYNPFKGSLVFLFDLQSSARPFSPHDHTNIETRIEQAIAPYLNDINALNENDENSTSSLDDIVVKVNDNKAVVIEANGKPVSVKPANPPVPQLAKESKNKGGASIPPPVRDVEAFFLEQKSTTAEANKFYNHFQSNGWKVGGKAPMHDWQAAARNWIANAPKFASGYSNRPPETPACTVLNTSKDYSEPL